MKSRLLLPVALSTCLLIFSGSYASTLSITSTNVTCNGLCNGAATISPVGNYRYKWDDGDSTPVVSNLCAGIHFCIISDSAGIALDTLRDTIAQPLLLTVNSTQVNTICNPANMGSISLVANGGKAPYFYNWSTGEYTANINGLVAGIYTCTVKDANNCSLILSDTLAPPDSVLITIAKTNASTCGTCNGSANVAVNRGRSPYRFRWSNADTVSALSNLCAGVFLLTVTDAYNCTNIGSAVLDYNNFNVSLGITPVTCSSHYGSIVTAVSGGRAPLRYIWDNGSTTANLDSLASGVYTLTVADSSGCRALAIGNVHTYTSYGWYINNQPLNPTCYFLGDISARVLNIPQCVIYPPYTYAWNTGQSTATIDSLNSGIYILKVTDSAGCVLTDTVPLYADSSYGFYVYTEGAPPNCSNNNGTIISTVYDSYPPYTYLWNTGPVQTGDTAVNLGAGDYAVTVTDNIGCRGLGEYSLYGVCENVVFGTAFFDSNGDCIFDSLETVPNGFMIIAYTTSGSYYYGNTDSYGRFEIDIPDTGYFTISLASGWGLNCNGATLCGTPYLHFTRLGDTTYNQNIALSTGAFDLALHPGWTSVDPGFQKEYWVIAYNQSYLPYTGKDTVIFSYDSNLIYQYSDNPQPIHNAMAHTLTWFLDSLPSQWLQWNSGFRSFFMVPATLSLNYLLRSDFKIFPYVGDCDTTNNEMYFSESCQGSLDPNSKTVTPSGSIPQTDSVLTYTIHFQNTGSDTTHFIIVKDTLSSLLDPATVRNVASSHPYTHFNISGTGILTWLFDPIRLVDSSTSATSSKGFITFQVKKRTNLPIGSVVTNSASIYFDYNPAVLTNKIADTVTSPTYTFIPADKENIYVRAFPNPFHYDTHILVSGLNQKFSFELFDISGRLLKQVPVVPANDFILTRDDLAPGIYLYSISAGTGSAGHGKLIVE